MKAQLRAEVWIHSSFHTIRPLKEKGKDWANAPIHQQFLHHMSAILRLGQIDDVICWDSRTHFPEIPQIPGDCGGGSGECCLLTFQLLEDDLPLLMAAKLKETLQHPHRVVSERHLGAGQEGESRDRLETKPHRCETSYLRYLTCPEGQGSVSVPSETHLFRLPTNQIVKLHHQLFLALCITVLSVDTRAAPIKKTTHTKWSVLPHHC